MRKLIAAISVTFLTIVGLALPAHAHHGIHGGWCVVPDSYWSNITAGENAYCGTTGYNGALGYDGSSVSVFEQAFCYQHGGSFAYISGSGHGYICNVPG